MGNTRPIQLQDASENAIWHWNEHIDFDIDVKDIPRGARLCIGIYALYGTNKKGKKKSNREVHFHYVLHLFIFYLKLVY